MASLRRATALRLRPILGLRNCPLTCCRPAISAPPTGQFPDRLDPSVGPATPVLFYRHPHKSITTTIEYRPFTAAGLCTSTSFLCQMPIHDHILAVDAVMDPSNHDMGSPLAPAVLPRPARHMGLTGDIKRPRSSSSYPSHLISTLTSPTSTTTTTTPKTPSSQCTPRPSSPSRP